MENSDMHHAEPTERKYISRHRVALALLAGCAVVAGGVYFGALPNTAPNINDEKYSVLEIRLQNLENSTALYADRITKLEKDAESQAHNAVSTAPAPAATNPTAAPASLPASPAPASADESKRIDALEKELATLKSAAPLQDSEHIKHSIRLLSAFHRLSDKVLSGKPYLEALTEYQNVFGDVNAQSKPLAQLAAHAEDGLPTLAALFTAFDNAADRVSVSQAVPPAEAGAWDKLKFNLTHLVRVRRNDQAQTGKDVDSVIGRASAHLDKGEVEGALAEISSLPKPAIDEFAGWIDEAQIYIDAPGLIDQLEEQVMQQVFHPSADPTPMPMPMQSDKGLNIQ